MFKFILESFDGRYQYTIPVKKDLWHWKSGKCWNVHCSNPIMVVHLTEHGNANLGYCLWCYENRIIRNIFNGGRGYTRGKWVMCEKHYKTKKVYLKEDKTSERMYKEFTKRFRHV